MHNKYILNTFILLLAICCFYSLNSFREKLSLKQKSNEDTKEIRKNKHMSKKDISNPSLALLNAKEKWCKPNQIFGMARKSIKELGNT